MGNTPAGTLSWQSGSIREGRVTRKSVSSIAVAVAIACLAVGAPAGAATSPWVGVKNAYGLRYCELFFANMTGSSSFHIDVFNTTGLNSCPDATVKALNLTTLAAAEGVLGVGLNGPRNWAMDEAYVASPPPPRTFQGLEMRLVATADVGSLGFPDFKDVAVLRTTKYVYNSGRTVHELTSPTGQRYLMQAYSNEINPSVSLSNLSTLATSGKLHLPAGWKYSNRRLSKKLTLITNGLAIITRDNLKGVYQRED